MPFITHKEKWLIKFKKHLKINKPFKFDYKELEKYYNIGKCPVQAAKEENNAVEDHAF